MSWIVSKKNGRTVELGDGRKITVPACPKDPPQAWSDAKKIAAANEMLSALIQARKFTKSYSGDITDKLNLAIDAAIKKATGGEA